jgi:hypothetical protein
MKQARSIIKNFYSNQPSKYTFLAAFLLFWFVISLGVIVANRGVYFANFHASMLMKVTTDGTKDVVSRFSSSPYVAALDRENSIVEFQSIPYDEFNKIVADLEEEDGVVSVESIEQTRILSQDVVVRFAWTAAAAVLIFSLFMYVTVVRKLMGINRNLTLRVVAFYAAALGIGLINVFGLLSLFSRFYELTDVSMLVLMITFLWGAALIFLTLYEIWEHHTNFYSNMLDVFSLNRRRLTWLLKISSIVWGIILASVAIGLGTRFAIDAVLIGAGVMIISASLQVLPNFLLRLNVTNVRSYSKMLRSYNAQAVPMYQRQVIAESKSKLKSKGSKVRKPKRRQ